MAGWNWKCFGCDLEVLGIATDEELDRINDEHECPEAPAPTAGSWVE